MNKKIIAHQKACKHYKQYKQPCLLCGSMSTVKHHENYDKPLNVIWLCRNCHSKYHNNKLSSICINLIKNCYRWFYVDNYVTYNWYIKNKAIFPLNKTNTFNGV